VNHTKESVHNECQMNAYVQDTRLAQPYLAVQINQTALLSTLSVRGWSLLKKACRPRAEPSDGLNQETRLKD
jgi:hypothetical protein